MLPTQTRTVRGDDQSRCTTPLPGPTDLQKQYAVSLLRDHGMQDVNFKVCFVDHSLRGSSLSPEYGRQAGLVPVSKLYNALARLKLHGYSTRVLEMVLPCSLAQEQLAK